MTNIVANENINSRTEVGCAHSCGQRSAGKGSVVLYLKALVISGFCLIVSVNTLQAESYHCTFKPNRIEKDLIPATLRIDWTNYLGPAKITDNIGVKNGMKWVHSELPIETGKRISFRWRLQQVSVPNLGLLTGYASKPRMDVIYSANYYLASKKIILRADPLVPWKPTTDFIRAVGRCKVVK